MKIFTKERIGKNLLSQIRCLSFPFVNTVSKLTLNATPVLVVLSRAATSLQMQFVLLVQFLHGLPRFVFTRLHVLAAPRRAVESLRQNHELYSVPSSTVPVQVFCM